jgi:hypothetical protein
VGLAQLDEMADLILPPLGMLLGDDAETAADAVLADRGGGARDQDLGVAGLLAAERATLLVRHRRGTREQLP